MERNSDFDISDGLSQSERFPLYLDPGHVKIDDRTAESFLISTIELSRLFNYYNHNNIIDGDWEDFFNTDIDVLVKLISTPKLKETIRKFDSIISNFNSAEEDEEITSVINEAFSLLFNMVQLLQKYRSKLSLSFKSNSLMVSLISIANSLDKEFESFLTGYRSAYKQFDGIVQLDLSKIADPGTKKVGGPNEKNIFDDGGDMKKQAASFSSWFDGLFSSLRLKFSNLISAAATIETMQTKGDIYDPHIGLFFTFLQLYQYLQDKMNDLNSRHLDFYYNKIVGIPFKQPVPDKMHVIFQAAPIRKNVSLMAGESLMAEVPVTKEILQYKLERDIVITQSQIKELKTGFIGQMNQFLPGYGNFEQVKEFRLYKADNPVVKTLEYENVKNNYKPWPLLGEEQGDLTQSQRTMEDASTGLIMTSPLLYARDGKRIFEIRFYLIPASFQQFERYVENFALATATNKGLVSHNMLDQSFLVRITGEKGWIQVKRYNIRLSQDPSEKYFALNFMLNASDPAIDVYNSAIHGGTYGLKRPALELMLNGALFHHPYSFYKDFLLERISITAHVTDSRDIRLQNSFGPLSPAVPFQIFGPLPSIGSYLDIKNTNIFNRFTKDCAVKLEWFDLPRDPGGFEAYFKGYDNGIKNESYRVSVSALQNAKQLAEPAPKQTFRLFETERTDTSQVLLSPETTLRDINCNQLRFKNQPLLKEEGNAGSQIFDGVIRIEFIAPDDGFGYRTYPQILPGIISHNARKYGHKYPVPNTPYIPVVKSVLIDYTLEHTEILKTGKHSEESHSIHLIHVYPFGYDAVYPEKENTDIYLLPPLAEESNLLIGLSQVEAGQELSILFQLEEMSFHHTAHDAATVHWSYLLENKWLPLKPENIPGDSTNHFVTSGIVLFNLPRDMANGNTVLNPELYWLKASSTGHNAGSRVIGIFTQAALAAHDVGKAERFTITDTLPPGSLKGFSRKIPDIVNIWQLFSTSGGRPQESVDDYRLRVSERLRHKDRLMTALDISQMILDAFPGILMVKCFGRGVSNDLILPGINLQIIVIPKERADGRFISPEPKVSLALLLKIKELVSNRLSSFATAEVGNPVYEKVKVVCSVWIEKKRLNSNDGYFINLLNEDIKKFITPWLFDNAQELKIGGKIYLSDILDYIKKRPYVSYVTGFSVLHLYRSYDIINGEFNATITDSSVDPSDYIEASRPDAILISSSKHIIHLLNNQDYTNPAKSGLGDLQIGNELPVFIPFVRSSLDDMVASSDEENNLDFNFNF